MSLALWLALLVPASPAELGKRLFFDPRLSADSSVSCASCHRPERSFTDGRAVSEGVYGRVGTRNAPALINRAAGESHFWDGRAATLEAQVLQPIEDPKEMGLPLAEALDRLRADAGYRAAFQAAFAREVTAPDLAAALAAFVRSVRSEDAPFDRFLRSGGDFSAEEREGFRLFRDKANCTACHAGPDFTDERFHNTGVAWREGQLRDPGRYAVTQREYHRGAFKTPSLREVGRTAPYMHNGSIATLEEVVEFYDRGGNPNPWLDDQIKPLRLTPAEKRAIAAFLRRGLDGRVRTASD